MVLPSRYRSGRLLAIGGMGEVYLATDSLLEREVAIKVLSERYADDADIRRRFMREALAAARLSGRPHVVMVFDVGEHDDRPFIVMAYMRGGSVDTRLKSGLPPLALSLDWLEQAGIALDGAHAAGIVHRDVKPGNLLLDAADSVHVGDFGIARAAGLDSLTNPGTILGTAGYLSPEQAAGMSAGPASDRYALGVVAFELLTGRRPFAADTAATEAFAHAHTPPPSARALQPALPNGLDGVLERALAKDPEARPRTCAELVDGLRRAIWEAESPTVVQTPLPAPPAATSRTPTVRHRWGRRALLAAAAILLALGGIAAAAVLSLGAGGKTPARKAGAPPPRTNTVTRTVTTTTAAGPAAPATPRDHRSLSQLNDAGYAKLRAGGASAALPLLERAVSGLAGSGSITEAYASYNLAWARFALGRCDGVSDLLDRSQAIQGHRKEIDQLRKQVDKRCGGDGRGRDKGDGQDKG
jgi:eukaryotic-like serine/threonine-protein kinase